MLKKGALFFAVMIGAAAIFYLIPTKFSSPVIADSSETIVEDTIPVIPHEPQYLYGIPIDSLVIVEDKVKRNESLASILSAYNVPHITIHDLAQQAKDIFDVRKIAPNKKYTLFFSPDSVPQAKSLVYEASALEYVVFHFGDSIKVDRQQKEIEVVEKEISGVIEQSLAATISELGVSPALTDKFADVFGWQVDFQRLQKGDRFKLIYEDLIVEGKSVGIGEIKGIYFEHFNNPYYAVPYDQDEGMDYFDEEGNSLRKALLKYPIKFTRISSRYTKNRFHPVQKRYKAHLGTDFAAPTGTTIRSVGDGIVQEARYKGGNGNFVKIRHNATYTTQYLHMSKIAGGIKPGTRVKQGQVIGYVGSTGLATGPHLCYRFWLNGRQVDALKVNLPPSAPIKADHKEAYEKVKMEVIERLDKIPFTETSPEFYAGVK
ncbi:MAG: peptidoglycan DD-metalloendopeptidase family protein [Candidatus Cyclobacteriaceae bacterium M2_1C_046]